MALLFPGALIRRERLRRGWSQEGLCRGICAVSYLSKIEQGKAEASGDLLDHRLCMTLAAGASMLACWLTIWKNRRDVRAVYEAQKRE